MIILLLNKKNKLKRLSYDEWMLFSYKKNKSFNEAKQEFYEKCHIGLWSHYNRILKDNGKIVLFASDPFTYQLYKSNEKNFYYKWYWEKNQGTNFFHAKRMPIRFVEEILVFRKNKKTGTYNPQKTTGHKPTNSAVGSSNGKVYHGVNKRNYKGGETSRYPKNILKFKGVDNYSRLHPNQKPNDLLCYLIETYTNEGDLVLDNVAGCGSTGVAAKKCNRNFILIEKDEKYFNIIKEQLNM